MRTLKFNVEGQRLKKDPACNFSGIVKGSKGYLQCSFSFSREWAGCKVAASFWGYDKELDAAAVVHGVCQIPDSVTDFRRLGISLTGVKDGYCITTNKIWIEQEG